MAVIVKSLFMRDLRGNWVFPRLAYATAGHAVDRNARKLFRFMVARPWNRVGQFLATLDNHERKAEILLAAFAVLVAFVRALSVFLAVIGSLIVLVHLLL